MDDAVRSGDIGANDLRAVDHHAGHRVYVNFAALNCCNIELFASDVSRHHFSRHHVISEDGDKLALVFRLE